MDYGRLLQLGSTSFQLHTLEVIGASSLRLGLHKRTDIKPLGDPRLDNRLPVYPKARRLVVEAGDHPLRKVDVNALQLPVGETRFRLSHQKETPKALLRVRSTFRTRQRFRAGCVWRPYQKRVSMPQRWGAYTRGKSHRALAPPLDLLVKSAPCTSP